MKFKSSVGEVRIALTSGHVTIIGEEWRELDERFRREAYAMGCISENMSGVDEPPPLDRKAEIKKAIEAMLAGDREDDFTKAGLPNLKRVRDLTKLEVTREEMEQAWAEHDK